MKSCLLYPQEPIGLNVHVTTTHVSSFNDGLTCGFVLQSFGMKIRLLVTKEDGMMTSSVGG